MNYYLGIDGGGTKTTAAVSDENGSIIIKITGKSINFYSVGMDNARKNLAEIIAETEACLSKSEFKSVFIGCSALDDEADEKLIHKLCDGIINAEKIRMHSDVYIALRSVGEAVCPCTVISGTGSMVVARDKNSNIHIAGGWGHIVGDEGSAYAIALNAFKLCCQQCDKNKVTPLLTRAVSFFGVDNFRKAIDIIYSSETTKDVIAGFAEKVGELALTGDADALGIIHTEAEALAQTVCVLLDRIECCSVLGLYGGVFQNNKIFSDAFSDKVKERYPDLKIKFITVPPEESALMLAREI